VFIRRQWAMLVSVLAGLVMSVFLIVDALSIDGKVGEVLPTVLAMQLLYFVPGVVVVALAGSLWRWEYRHHVHFRPA
jgi:hypothetical protein